MRVVSIKMPTELDRKLTNLARAKGISRSAVAREAIAAYVPAQGSAAELADDLIGRLRGPKDLSTGRHHMTGYGK